MLRRLGADPRPNQVAAYPQRILGIRTRDPGRCLVPAGQRPVQAQAWQPCLRTVDRRQLLP